MGRQLHCDMILMRRQIKIHGILIPLTQNSDVSKYGFIKFIQNQPALSIKVEEKRDFKVDLSGMQMYFNLDVTPEAEIQIIFDSKMGDIIKRTWQWKDENDY